MARLAFKGHREAERAGVNLDIELAVGAALRRKSIQFGKQAAGRLAEADAERAAYDGAIGAAPDDVGGVVREISPPAARAGVGERSLSGARIAAKHDGAAIQRHTRSMNGAEMRGIDHQVDRGLKKVITDVCAIARDILRQTGEREGTGDVDNGEVVRDPG